MIPGQIGFDNKRMNKLTLLFDVIYDILPCEGLQATCSPSKSVRSPSTIIA
jgi:hypothetical protein